MIIRRLTNYSTDICGIKNNQVHICLLPVNYCQFIKTFFLIHLIVKDEVSFYIKYLRAKLKHSVFDNNKNTVWIYFKIYPNMLSKAHYFQQRLIYLLFTHNFEHKHRKTLTTDPFNLATEFCQDNYRFVKTSKSEAIRT